MTCAFNFKIQFPGKFFSDFVSGSRLTGKGPTSESLQTSSYVLVTFFGNCAAKTVNCRINLPSSFSFEPDRQMNSRRC